MESHSKNPAKNYQYSSIKLNFIIHKYRFSREKKQIFFLINFSLMQTSVFFSRIHFSEPTCKAIDYTTHTFKSNHLFTYKGQVRGGGMRTAPLTQNLIFWICASFQTKLYFLCFSHSCWIFLLQKVKLLVKKCVIIFGYTSIPGRIFNNWHRVTMI